MTAGLLVGAFIGAGLAALLWWLTPLVPDPVAAEGLRHGPPAGHESPLPGSGLHGLLDRVTRLVVPSARSQDLELLGTSASELTLRKLGYALLGLLFPPLLSLVMALVGLRLPFAMPLIAGAALGVALFLVPDVDVVRRAAAAREEIRHALWVYLELVALERAADAGVGEALERAAAIGDARFFDLVRDALTRTQLAGEAPWHAFERLGARLGVPELTDVTQIMRLTGEDGAGVYGTLRSRAASLRGALLAESATRANSASEQMVAPVAMLGVAFLLLLGYPALARIVFG